MVRIDRNRAGGVFGVGGLVMELPLKCICGYQAHIDRLEKRIVEWENIALSLWRDVILTDDEMDLLNETHDRKFRDE